MHEKREENEAVSIPHLGSTGNSVNRDQGTEIEAFGRLVKCLAVSRPEAPAHKEWVHHWVRKFSHIQPELQVIAIMPRMVCSGLKSLKQVTCQQKILDVIKMLFTEIFEYVEYGLEYVKSHYYKQ